jgi:NAD(P)-dependent dehydrogenase (short-subunit alcohol dehydrogenase family)
MPFGGKDAVASGGAAGIGKAIARRWRSGAAVVIADVGPPRRHYRRSAPALDHHALGSHR